MKITFLGTGTSQGIPVIACQCPVCLSKDIKDKRLRSSISIEVDDLKLVIDAGPDFRQQILRANIKKLDAILITHGHKDHVGGLDDVRAFNYLQKKPMAVYGGSFALSDIQREFHYAFEENQYPGAPQIELIELNNGKFKIKNTEITIIEGKHYNRIVYGFRIKNFTYLTDFNFISEKEIEKIKGTKILVINALRKEKHYSHFNLEEALALINKINPDKAYLTHISHLMGTHSEVSSELPFVVELAYDNLTIEV